MSFGVLTARANCNFSDVTFEKFSQRGNEIYFQTNLDEDACLYFYFTAYDYQLKRLDTIRGFGSYVGVSFNTKGKYQMRLNVVNECEKCDTVLTIDVDITVFGKVFVDAKPSTKSCKAYSFALKDFQDTCIEYYYSVWKADPWINKLTDTEYNKLTDSALYFGYSFDDEKYLIDYNMKSKRTFNIEFKDSGRHFVLATWVNTCSGIDTFMFKKIDVCRPAKTTNTNQIIKHESITVVGYYDMLGCLVDYVEPNKVYIVLYSNGKYAKVVREQ